MSHLRLAGLEAEVHFSPVAEIWLQKGPRSQIPKLILWQPYWIRPKVYLTSIKVLSEVMNVPNIKEIILFMSEIWSWNGSQMLSMGNM